MIWRALARVSKAPIAIEAVERIDVLFAIEREISSIYFDLRTVTTIPARITDNLLRVGVNYKFDGADIWTND